MKQSAISFLERLSCLFIVTKCTAVLSFIKFVDCYSWKEEHFPAAWA